jgi:putative ABC transport system permease protein
MKLFPLIWRNALRNRLRTGLTVAGIGLLLFVILFVVTALTEIQAWEGEAASHLRVVVQHSTGLAELMPIQLQAYLEGDEVRRHAKQVMKFNWYGAYYQDPANFFAQFAVDHDRLLEVLDEIRPAPDVMEALAAKKNGTIVGERLLRRYSWKVGQTVTLTGTFYSANPELEIVGTFTTPNVRQEEQMFFRWDYFDEIIKLPNKVGTFWLTARTAEDIPRLKELIDAHTKNSSDPTETLTEKEFAVQFMEMMGNIKVMVVGISSVVLAIMVLLTANTMAMAARERVVEIAVLRTLGFTAGHVALLVVGEAVLVSLLAAVLPCAAAFLLFSVVEWSPSALYFPVFIPLPGTYAFALGVAAFCGVASSVVPAWQASRRRIVDGLRRVD